MLAAFSPQGVATLLDANGNYFEVEYSGDLSIRDGALPVKSQATDAPLMKTYYCQYGASCPCRGLSQCRSDFPEAPIRGVLVWARPQYADMPLWNAQQVRGNVVVILRFAPALPRRD